jgi:hypothetical protein
MVVVRHAFAMAPKHLRAESGERSMITPRQAVRKLVKERCAEAMPQNYAISHLFFFVDFAHI